MICPNCGQHELVLRTTRNADQISSTWHCPGEPHFLTPAGLVPHLPDPEQQRKLVRAPLNRRNANARA